MTPHRSDRRSTVVEKETGAEYCAVVEWQGDPSGFLGVDSACGAAPRGQLRDRAGLAERVR